MCTHYAILSDLKAQVILDSSLQVLIFDTWQYLNTNLQLFCMTFGLKLFLDIFLWALISDTLTVS